MNVFPRQQERKKIFLICLGEAIGDPSARVMDWTLR